MRDFSDKRPLSNVLLVTDIDGTLLGHRGELPERNVKSINKFIELGGHFSIATGRTADSAIHLAGNFQGKMAPFIVSNGSQIYDMSVKKTVWGKLLDNETKDYMRLIHKKFPHTCLEVATEDGIYCNEPNETARWQLDYEKIGYTVGDIDDILELECYKANFIDDVENMASVRKYISSLSDFECEIVDSGNRYYEILPKGCNKGSALIKLAEMMKVSILDTAAIGDYLNDIELIESAGIKAAPMNAADEIKNRVDYIFCDCSDGAVAELIEILIGKYAINK